MKLEDICNVSSSKRIFAREYAETGVPFWRGKEVTEHATGKDEMTGLFISDQRYEALIDTGNVPSVDDVLITAVGTIGSVYQVKYDDLPFYFKDGNIIRLGNWVNKLVIPTYVCLYLRSNIGQQAIKEVEIGSTQKALTIKDVARILIPLPKIDIQKKIASIIETIDLKIQLNQQINKNLLKLSSNIVMAASLKSERITDLQTLLDSSRKANISIDEVSLDTYVSNTSLRANKRGLDTAEDYPSVKTVRAVEPGDVLVGNIRPYFKKIWFADRKGGASNDVITFRADNTTVTPEFLFGILYSDRFFDYVTATSKGTKMPRGDKQAIALYQVGLPDKDVITSVSDVVNPMLEQVSLNEKQNQQLTKLRNLLLPKLLAGDIDLSNIETVMNNA